jgi:hypothetical protein
MPLQLAAIPLPAEYAAFATQQRSEGGPRRKRIVLVFNSGNISWSSCGAERSQPSASRKHSRPTTAESKPKPLRSASLHRLSTSMVRRRSTRYVTLPPQSVGRAMSPGQCQRRDRSRPVCAGTRPRALVAELAHAGRGVSTATRSVPRARGRSTARHLRA